MQKQNYYASSAQIFSFLFLLDALRAFFALRSLTKSIMINSINITKQTTRNTIISGSISSKSRHFSKSILILSKIFSIFTPSYYHFHYFWNFKNCIYHSCISKRQKYMQNDIYFLLKTVFKKYYKTFCGMICTKEWINKKQHQKI